LIPKGLINFILIFEVQIDSLSIYQIEKRRNDCDFSFHWQTKYGPTFFPDTLPVELVFKVFI